MSAFQIFHNGNSTFINLFDKTKFSLRGKIVFQTGQAHGGIFALYCVSSVHNMEEKFASF